MGGGVRMLCWGLLVLCAVQVVAAQLPNCSYPAVYAFGDSLSDTGNAIAAFPEKFANAEKPPGGILFPLHAADRYCDGKLFLDFLTFGVRRRPIYPILRATGGDYTYGTNFAASGAPARTVKTWDFEDGFSTPFSLNIQQQWYERYKVRVFFFESPIFNPGLIKQSLPKFATINESLYLIWSGYQDYFHSLYYKKLTVTQTKSIVADVVGAIETHIEKMLTTVYYSSPGVPRMAMPTANELLVVNLPPLGCIPAMLTLYGGPQAKYDGYGCLSELNLITAAHNKQLGEKIVALRAKHPTANIYYGDAHGVYTDILRSPSTYNVTAPLKACCGAGGNYNFNTEVRCGQAGIVEGKFVNLSTILPAMPCANPRNHLSWDGFHTSDTFNRAAVTDFLLGKHITPAGGLGCSPDFFFWNSAV